MLKYLTVAIALFAIGSNAAVVSPASVGFARAIGNAPFALTGFTDCGVSTLKDVRFEGCTAAPCQLTPGATYNLAIDFDPRDFHCCLSHAAIFLKDIQLFPLSEGPVEGSVTPGQVFTFNYQFRVPSDLNGVAEMRLKVFQNYVHELCMVIPVRVG